MKEFLLIAQAVHGNRKALEQLVGRYYEKIYQYIFYKVRDKSIAEVLTQDVFLKLVKNIHAYVPTASFSSYLYRIAHNRVVDYYRTMKFTEELSEGQTVTDPLKSVEEKITIEGLLCKLPEEQRECIILYYMQELTYREISQILKIPIPTAKSRVQRGLKACKKILEENHGSI